MTRSLHRWLAMVLLLLPLRLLHAEKVADLPMPTRYVNDFAGILSPTWADRIESLSRAAHDQAHADLALVTVKQLEDGQTVEEFTAALEEKWKLGKKGEDRSAIYVIVLSPRKTRIEVGYGLEGILNDAKVGAILDTTLPYLRQQDYDTAAMTGMQGIADVVAADAHVTLQPIVPRAVRRTQRAPAHFGLPQALLGLGAIFVLFILIRTGNIGWAFFLLQALLGGGGGGGRDDDRGGGGFGGGFGGSGGGESGGGGASRDW